MFGNYLANLKRHLVVISIANILDSKTEVNNNIKLCSYTCLSLSFNPELQKNQRKKITEYNICIFALLNKILINGSFYKIMHSC